MMNPVDGGQYKELLPRASSCSCGSFVAFIFLFFFLSPPPGDYSRASHGHNFRLHFHVLATGTTRSPERSGYGAWRHGETGATKSVQRQ